MERRTFIKSLVALPLLGVGAVKLLGKLQTEQKFRGIFYEIANSKAAIYDPKNYSTWTLDVVDKWLEQLEVTKCNLAHGERRFYGI